jgi:hypothetical protein
MMATNSARLAGAFMLVSGSAHAAPPATQLINNLTADGPKTCYGPIQSQNHPNLGAAVLGFTKGSTTVVLWQSLNELDHANPQTGPAHHYHTFQTTPAEWTTANQAQFDSANGFTWTVTFLPDGKTVSVVARGSGGFTGQASYMGAGGTLTCIPGELHGGPGKVAEH